MLLVPILVNWLAPHNAIHEWRYVFFVVFFILFFTNIIFCLFCSAEAAPWAVNNNKRHISIQNNKTKEVNKSFQKEQLLID